MNIGYSAAIIEDEAQRIVKRFKEDNNLHMKIEMIKALRNRLSGFGLREAKDAIEEAIYRDKLITFNDHGPAPSLGDILGAALKNVKDQTSKPVDKFFVIVDGQFYTAETEAEAKRVRSFLYTILDTNKVVTIIRGEIV